MVKKGGWQRELAQLPLSEQREVRMGAFLEGSHTPPNIVDLFRGNFKSTRQLRAWDDQRPVDISLEMAHQIRSILGERGFHLLDLSARGLKQADERSLYALAKSSGYPNIIESLKSATPDTMRGMEADRLPAAAFAMRDRKLQVTTGFLRQIGQKDRVDAFWDGLKFEDIDQMSPWLVWTDRGPGRTA